VKLQLPAALPAIFTGFRIAAGQAVIGAVVGDFFFKQGDPGIGVLIDLYASQLESERLYASVIVASVRDPERFAAIYDRHAAAIHRYLARRLGVQVADDLVGETTFRWEPSGPACIGPA